MKFRNSFSRFLKELPNFLQKLLVVREWMPMILRDTISYKSTKLY